jgi:hypothetical protein
MNLILYPANINKVLESNYIPKYINIKRKAQIEIINYNIDKNINEEVIKSYKKYPDILIINFDNISPIIIKNIPRYPIFINNMFYITPICYQQLNGFSNDNNNKQYLINDFIERIKRILGGILSINDFKFQNISYVNMDSGIKNIMDIKFEKNWFVNKIPKWMTTDIEINNSGWFSIYNQLAIDYIFENYKINKTVELGAYYGLSTKYIINKNINSTLYSFDLYDNILLTNYVVKNITQLDINYFFKYIKFESFHSNLSNFENLYSVKYDCYSAPELLKKYNINIDLFYIDFCKKDKLLIQFVDNIFKLYPECIIIGDDAPMLSSSLKYFENKYDYVYLRDCYICSYKTKLINTDKLLEKYNKEKEYQNTNDIELLKNIDINYRIKYIGYLINNYKNNSDIIKYLDILNIDPNIQSHYLIHNSNLFHHIAYSSNKNYEYYIGLYNILNEKYNDKDISNDLNLIPNDYFNYDLKSLFT